MTSSHVLFRRSAMWAAAAWIALLVSCGGGSSDPAAPAVIPRPTIQIGIEPGQVSAGGTATMTWSSTDAAECVASGNWSGSQPLSGSLTANFSEPGVFTYRIDCSNSSGTSSASTLAYGSGGSGGSRGQCDAGEPGPGARRATR